MKKTGKIRFFPLKTTVTEYNKGFTLIELLVSISIFLFLGIMLISVFKSGMDLWHAGEARKIVYTRANNILSALKDDFSHMFVHDFPKENGEEVDIRLISDLLSVETNPPEFPVAYSHYRQRVRFVRHIPFELKDSVMLEAGSYPTIPDPSGRSTPADPSDDMKFYDHFDDSTELGDDVLAATGGLAEVGYLLKGENLYRAIKAPVGYKADVSGNMERVSLFNGDSFFDLGTALTTNAHVLGRNVLHFEIRFWAPDTTTPTWDITEGGRLAGEASYEWDSTVVPTNEFPFHEDILDKDPDPLVVEPAVPGDPSDDLFPPKLKVILVVDSGFRTRRLSRVVSDDGDTIVCTSTAGFEKMNSARQFIKVNNEWIHYTLIGERAFSGLTRGVRHTEQPAAAHGEGIDIYQGETFFMVIDVPGVEND